MQWNGVSGRRQARVAPRVCGRVGNGGGMEARQGAIRVFWGDTYPAILILALRRQPAASALEPDLHETPMRDLAKPGPARRPGRSRRVSREKAGAFSQGLARGDGSRDRASGEAGMVGRGTLRKTMGFLQKRKVRRGP